MNSLQRDIRPGEVVIVSAYYAPPEQQADRRFKCYAGAGLDAKSFGRRIVGRWLGTQLPDSIVGAWIDPTETAALAQQGGQP